MLSCRIAISLWVIWAGFALASCSAGTAARTEVIRFTPATPGGEAREGYCWIGSLVEGRPDAYRCMAGNQIFDPCFAKDGEAVVCGANPVTNETGFVLKLTQPLPSVRPPSVMLEERAWMLQLVDGTMCSFSTGATGVIEGKRLNYACGRVTDAESTWILGNLQQGDVWHAHKAVVRTGREGLSLKKSERVAVLKVWQ